MRKLNVLFFFHKMFTVFGSISWLHAIWGFFFSISVNNDKNG